MWCCGSTRTRFGGWRRHVPSGDFRTGSLRTDFRKHAHSRRDANSLQLLRSSGKPGSFAPLGTRNIRTSRRTSGRAFQTGLPDGPSNRAFQSGRSRSRDETTRRSERCDRKQFPHAEGKSTQHPPSEARRAKLGRLLGSQRTDSANCVDLRRRSNGIGHEDFG
jgi:hypothetical protein